MVVPFDFFHKSSPKDKKKKRLPDLFCNFNWTLKIVYIVRKVFFSKYLPTKNLKNDEKQK